MPDHDSIPLVEVDLSGTLGPDFECVVSDGLPLAPVSINEVDRLLNQFDARPEEVVGIFPPAYAQATLRGLATYCILAGAPNAIFPALVAAARAISQEPFNLLAVQTTTSAVGVATILCGPTVRSMGFFGGSNGSGPGPLANVTLGRALRLALINIGGAVPDTLDPASIGWPGKLGFTIVENERDSPWGSYRSGFDAVANLLIAMPANGFVELTDSKSGTGQELMASFSRMLCFVPETARSEEALILLTPHHARLLAQAGRSRRDFQDAVASIMGLSDATKVVAIVTGGTGGKSASIPLWGESRGCLASFSNSTISDTAHRTTHL